mgnify:CR=1 FL=1
MSKSSIKCNEWLPKLQALSESFTTFVESESFKGQAATSVKNYLKEVHGILISIIGNLVQTYCVLAIDYYGGYTRMVDSGNSNKYGLRYTTIVCDEVSETGSVQRKLNDILRSAEQVVIDANSVKGSVSDLVSIASYPKICNLYEQINAAKSRAQTVHDNAIAYEASRVNDFNELDRLVSQALSIINAQIGEKRIPVIEYQQGSIGTMCDINQVIVDIDAISKKLTSITDNEFFESDASLVLNRDALIQEEAEASREWIRWVAIGFAVVGSIVLTAFTLGGAAPGVCFVVGAVVGGSTAATNGIADNYVKNGTLFKGLDVKEFGKDVLVGTIGGGVAGYLGAISSGSAIKQPIEKGLSALTNTVVKETAKGMTAVAWETGETIYEVGDAVIAGKPGGEIISVLNEGVGEMEAELSDTFKNVVSEGAKDFVGGVISGKFNIDTSDKSILRKIGEKTVEGVAGGVSGSTVKTLWNVGEAVVDNDRSTTVESALKEGVKDTVQEVTKSTASAVITEGFFSGVDDINNKTGKVFASTVKDTADDTVKKVAAGVSGRTMDYFYGDKKDVGKILGDIWEDDLDKGRSIAKAAGESVGKNISDAVFSDKKFYNNLKKIDKDGDGKIEVVQFDDFAVTKQDYNAAVENAGKGAYKDKSVQDILGLPKDMDISTGKERTVSIGMTEKYSPNRKTIDTVTVGGKYTFRKDYYESTLNAAHTEKYGGKTAQEVLGIPNDVDLSENNTSYKRVSRDKIGQGREVEFYKDYDTNTTKIHISRIKRETDFEKKY